MRINTSLLTTLTQTIKTNPFKSVSNKFANLFSKISGVKNSQEDFNSQPCKFFKSFSINYDTARNLREQTGFLSHYGRNQEPAIFIHGSGTHYTNGKGIQYYKGLTINDKDQTGKEAEYSLLNVKEFVSAVKKDFNIDLHRTGNTGVSPLHLICCFSGGFSSDSIAGQLSRELDRSVISYGNDIPLYMFGELLDKGDENSQVYCEDSIDNRKCYLPLREVIHFPDNQPGQFRE